MHERCEELPRPASFVKATAGPARVERALAELDDLPAAGDEGAAEAAALRLRRGAPAAERGAADSAGPPEPPPLVAAVSSGPPIDPEEYERQCRQRILNPFNDFETTDMVQEYIRLQTTIQALRNCLRFFEANKDTLITPDFIGNAPRETHLATITERQTRESADAREYVNNRLLAPTHNLEFVCTGEECLAGRDSPDGRSIYDHPPFPVWSGGSYPHSIL